MRSRSSQSQTVCCSCCFQMLPEELKDVSTRSWRTSSTSVFFVKPIQESETAAYFYISLLSSHQLKENKPLVLTHTQDIMLTTSLLFMKLELRYYSPFCLFTVRLMSRKAEISDLSKCIGRRDQQTSTPRRLQWALLWCSFPASLYFMLCCFPHETRTTQESEELSWNQTHYTTEPAEMFTGPR